MEAAYKYQKIDAFTSGASLGNPAACLYLAPGQSLSSDEMQAVAKQHQGFVSEVIYCEEDEAGISLTYYSSECEVDFCGHGTIACMYGLLKGNPVLAAQREIPVRTNQKGMITVYNRIAEQDAVLITAPEPRYIGTNLSSAAIADALGIGHTSIESALPIDFIDAGLRTLIVPIVDLNTAISFYPEESELKHFCLDNGIDIILSFSTETKDGDRLAHTRVFAPKFGYLEDPATGSGNSACGYYMLKNGLWDGSDCRIEQGGDNRIFNDVCLSNRNGAVLFGGSATVRIDGVYYV